MCVNLARTVNDNGEIPYDLVNKLQINEDEKAKLILVGDHDQLQPIGPGAPFRALLEQVGFAELNTIIRQEEEWQRQATHHFATSNVKEAINAYHEKGNIHFSEPIKNATQQLIEDWHAKYTKENLNLNQVLILAHRNTDVTQLNQMARARRILAGEITQGIMVNKENEEFYLSQGDRLLFLKNDQELDVKNGQFGTVTDIHQNEVDIPKQIIVKLDNEKTVAFDPEIYCHFNYGYSATVHKTQGVTIDHSFIYVSGKFWNRNLAYVAGSRHRKNMDLYVDEESYSNLSTLIEGIEKDGLKDSALNYPLNFAKRRGLESEGLYERAKKCLLERLIKTRDYIYEKCRHLIQNQRIDNQAFQDAKNVQSSDSKQFDRKIELTTTKLEKLLTHIEQAKREKNYYDAYKARRELQHEVKRISKNKNVYQEIKNKNVQLGKKLDFFLESEYEI